MKRPARRQRVGVDDRRARVQRVGDDLRGLTCASQGTREDDVEAHLDAREPSHAASQAGHAFRRERTLGVVRPRFAALFGEPVADEIELVRSGHVYL